MFDYVEWWYEDELRPLLVVTVRCKFVTMAAPPGTRIVHTLWVGNAEHPEAAENAFLRWNAEGLGYEDDDAYRAAVDRFLRQRVYPALEALSPRVLQSAPHVPVFLASSSYESVTLRPELPDFLHDSQISWLQQLPLRSAFQPTAANIPYIAFDSIRAINVFDTGSRGPLLVLMSDNRLAVSQCVPSLSMVTSPSGLSVIGRAVIHEMDVLRSIPPHPHIIAPLAYITREVNGDTVVCGYALKYCPGGCLSDMLQNVAVPQARRIKWAYQMSTALRHIHHVAHTYHGDIKLNNVVLDEHDDAIFIDFEQCRTNEEGAPPELLADCTVVVGNDGRLRYEASQSGEPLVPLRQRDYPYGNWKDVPRAIEAGEVYTFGVALGELFQEGEVESGILVRCRHVDPNERPDFREVEQFFEAWYTSI
ncbi:kinase-like protein [Polyporus arcularius HHB13444]|uniref:Kinase-like protein n=1 Tax=Polyporus arcularius HHB13444 TaxID=1314778 RepID=A0A5C3NZ04_9APHY|nr:kinase-like protein [Polyporus arcularius HHB13444]